MHRSYSIIARECQVPGYDGRNPNYFALVKQWLEVEHQGRWLMVVDNADDAELFYGTQNFNKYLPRCSQGMLLVTTRNKQVAVKVTKGQHSIEVNRMKDDEARDLMAKRLKDPFLSTSDLLILTSRLEHLPLALSQAAAFMQENNMTINEYLEFLENDETLIKLLDEDFEADGRDADSLHALAKTWTLSFRQIQQQNPFAGDLLSFLTICDESRLQDGLITTYIDRNHNSKGPLERAKALGVLKAFSLVS
ncbi:hypothetical protein IL306_013824, partial [Fusarium sp. DS 682]